MPQVQSYQDDDEISLNDKVIGTDADDANKTKNYRFAKIIQFLSNQGFSVGVSAYQSAVNNGFSGTEIEWLASLDGEDGLSAYQLALQAGFVGDLAAWLLSLKGEDGELASLTIGNVEAANNSTIILNYGVNYVNSSLPGLRVVLPEGDIVIGSQKYVFVYGDCFIRGNQANTAIIVSGQSAAAQIAVKANQIYRFTKQGPGLWTYELMNPTLYSPTFLDFRKRIFQGGTTAPSFQATFIDELTNTSVPNTDPLYRDVVLLRSGVGTYSARIRTKNGVSTNSSKVDISFSDAKVKCTGFSSGGDGTYSYVDFTFESKNDAGALADDIITFTNIYIRIYS